MTDDDNVLSTVRFYDALAPVYDRELVTRGGYAEAINEIILAWAREHECRSILDLGCGNGWRLQRLMEATGAKGVGLDLSPGMVKAARQRGLDAFVQDMAAPSFDTDQLPITRFDLVVCTWCIGHLLEPDKRLNALRSVRSLLSPNGALIIDVNNSLNAAAYGWLSALRNGLRAALEVPGFGNFVTHRTTPERELSTRVHLFTRPEIIRELNAAELHPAEVRYVNYATGKAASIFSGQICLVAQPKSS